MSLKYKVIGDSFLSFEADCKEIMLVKTDGKNNNNKFYHLFMDSNETVKAIYGRVGAKGTEVIVGSGLHCLDKKANEKFRKGYLPVEVSNKENEVNKDQLNLEKIAIDNLITNKSLKKDKETLIELIKELVSSNKHKITEMSGGKITIDDSGLVKTALGVVSLKNIQTAKNLLAKLKKEVSKNTQKSSNYFDNLNEYLMLIPQVVPSKKGWAEDYFEKHTSFEKQEDFLEQLEKSVELYNNLVELKIKEKNSKEKKEQETLPVLFKKQLKIVKDKDILKKIKDYFEETKNDSHSSKHLNIANVYEIVEEKETVEQFEKLAKEIGNVNLYWHGTRKYNLLSILKNGLVIPNENSFNVTGRMFGNGVYFSKQSTKSLNYSYGYWDNHSKDEHCFMFLADVIMGKTFKADHKYAEKYAKNRTYPVEGFDSTIATGGRKNLTHTGYMQHLSNDEMIIYSTDRILLKYLIEFN